MNIINPNFKVNEDKNIFTIRRQDYDEMLPTIKSIVDVVKVIDFDIVELGFRDSRFSSGELSKTIKNNLIIKLQKGSALIDLNIAIPKLIDDNYIVINGRKKIPIFQLFDIPIVTRGENIKLRTNVATIMVIKDKEGAAKEKNFIYVSFLGKVVPLAVLMFAFFGYNVMNEKFNLRNIEVDPASTNMYENLLYDLQLCYESSEGYTEEDFTTEVGRHYTKYNIKSKGEDILFALNIIPHVDPMSARFFKTETVLDEIVEAIKTPQVDDSLFTNKRIRCFEYVVVSKISKIIFDLCYANRSVRSPKFNINSTQILSECNVSEIVQFDFSINPVEELTKLSRCSLLGPGGFKRENIPRHLRDICPSMFGRVCPVDTPDRDNCGVLQNLLPNVDLDKNLKFTDKILDKSPISIPVSFVPFLKNDDQTRLQMAASQMRQSIMLKTFDVPLVSSGCEGLYTQYTQFVKIAKKDGEVVYIDRQYIIVVYNDETADIFDVGYRKIYVEHLDIMNVYVKKGDKFKKGDILAESRFCKDGKTIFGKNLLTGVMIYYGNNYEDGIVISDRLVKENVLTSFHFDNLSFILPPDKVLRSLNKPGETYKPLPEELEKIAIGQPYAITQKFTSEDFNSVFSEPNMLIAEKNYIITEVNIYPNEWNKEIPQFDKWVEKKIKEQEDLEKNLQNVITEKLPKENALKFIKENSLDKFSFTGKYREKKEKVEGMIVNISGMFFRPIRVGDKIGNRHGNKGVVSKILQHEKMPQTEDGKHIDICINPLGILSRMNIGQIYELHLSMSFKHLKDQIMSMIKNNENQKKIKKYLLDYIKIIDKTKDNWYIRQFIEQLPDKITEEFIQDLTIVQAPFESCKIDDIKKALSYTNTPFKQRVFDPISKDFIKEEIAVGMIYFFRMVHIAEEKLAARGIGSYARRTLQPLGGRKNKGGQRLGEMETSCLIGHDAVTNLFEFLTTKSDSTELKNAYIRNLIETNVLEEEIDLDAIPESVKLLNAYLTVIGVDLKSN